MGKKIEKPATIGKHCDTFHGQVNSDRLFNI